MAHPVYCPTKSYFYPIGNTAPVSLTQHLSPEESADILLLGCGDPRNILFTIHTDHGLGSRKMDFTCCDWEPGTLARNAILLTLIGDMDKSVWSTKLWNIFYHFNIDRQSLDLLAKHCQKLVDLSADLATWNASPYSRFLRFCSSRTQSTLRRYWSEYTRIATLPPVEQAVFNRKFTAARLLAKSSNVCTAARNVGPVFMGSISFADDHYKHYWETGVIAADAGTVSDATFANPTLAFSSVGNEFAVHYGTDPITGFHLSPAFSSLKEKSFDSTSLINVGQCAKAQFTQWCASFHAAVVPDADSSSAVMVRLHVGEALSFCHALRLQTLGIYEEGPFVSLWGGERIALDDSAYGSSEPTNRAPTTFNMIDSSNLTDHLGLINMLVSVGPILSPSLSSLFVSETLLSAEDNPVDGFKSRLFADTRAIALLLGLVPTSYDTLFTSRSSHHELVLQLCSSSPQAHGTMAWKLVPRSESRDFQPPGRVGFEYNQLAELLFSIYLRMFDSENVSSTFQRMNASRDSAMRRVQSLTLEHYTRRSFALFLRAVMDNVATDWTRTMDTLIDLMEADHTLMLGANNYQEFCCQLHLLGIYTVSTLKPNQTAVPVDDSRGRFRTWSDIPSVICVTLVVPRQRIKILSELDVNQIGTPILQASTRQPNGHNIFMHIQIMFGKCRVTGPSSNPTVVVDEDAAGWKGTSPLAVSFWMPSWILRLRPDGTKVCLGLHQTPGAAKLMRRLGPFLSLFEADQNDEKSVLFSRERPCFGEELELAAKVYPRHGLQPERSLEGLHELKVELDAHQVPILLKLRINIIDSVAQAALGEGAKVSVEQVSPCNVSMWFKDYRRIVTFPLSVDGRNLKTLVARKSRYIELQAPLSNLDDPTSFFINAAPILTKPGPLLSTFHYVKLNLMPALDTNSKSNKLEWLNGHTQLALSDKEMALFRSRKEAPEKVIFNVKQSVNIMLDGFCGLNSPRNNVFGLAFPPDVGVYTLIFVQDLRLDLASHTVVLDACILPMTLAILSDVLPDVRAITTNGNGVTQIITSEKELRVWKQLLPAFVERCRTWSHTRECEYIKKGAIPLSSEAAESPICSCGKGKDLGAFASVHPYPRLSPYVTRAAISQLFAVPYLESIGGELRRGLVGESKRYPADVCQMCGGSGKPTLLVCGRCKSTKYCSAECQRKAWPAHKIECKK